MQRSTSGVVRLAARAFLAHGPATVSAIQHVAAVQGLRVRFSVRGGGASRSMCPLGRAHSPASRHLRLLLHVCIHHSRLQAVVPTSAVLRKLWQEPWTSPLVRSQFAGFADSAAGGKQDSSSGRAAGEAAAGEGAGSSGSEAEEQLTVEREQAVEELQTKVSGLLGRGHQRAGTDCMRNTSSWLVCNSFSWADRKLPAVGGSDTHFVVIFSSLLLDRRAKGLGTSAPACMGPP